MNGFLEKVKSIILGHAVADALGVPVEFKSREILLRSPVTEMRGYGTYFVPAGSWSDDTSMSLCTLDAIENNRLDFDTIMYNFSKWYYNGEYTPTGEVFDVGGTCARSIEAYVIDKKPWRECGRSDESSNGNGSLMRMNPVVLYVSQVDVSQSAKIDLVELTSVLTHAHERSRIGCGIFACVMWEILKEPSKAAVKRGLKKAYEHYKLRKEAEHYMRLFDSIGDIFDKGAPPLGMDKIKSSGYIVDTLEASIWCLLTTDSYKECVIKAVNLGEDTDTVGAVAGSLAGAMYGLDAIPEEWLGALLKRDYIENLCEKAFGGENG